MSRAKSYAHFLETLSPSTLNQIDDFVTKDVHFIDPFFDVVGSDKFKNIFLHMFKTARDFNFKVDDIFEKDEETVIVWTFSAKMFGLSSNFSGVSHIKFDAKGLVSEHHDYWDSGKNIFAKTPIVGQLLRFVYWRAAKAIRVKRVDSFCKKQ